MVLQLKEKPLRTINTFAKDVIPRNCQEEASYCSIFKAPAFQILNQLSISDVLKRDSKSVIITRGKEVQFHRRLLSYFTQKGQYLLSKL